MDQTRIIDKHEKRFQDKLIAEIKGLGGFAIHLEPSGHSGFPDLLVTKGRHFILVELKSVENAHRQKLESIFEIGQLSWHGKWMQEGCFTVLSMIEVRGKSEVIFFQAENVSELIKSCTMTLKEAYDTYPVHHRDSVAQILMRWLE